MQCRVTGSSVWPGCFSSVQSSFTGCNLQFYLKRKHVINQDLNMMFAFLKWTAPLNVGGAFTGRSPDSWGASRASSFDAHGLRPSCCVWQVGSESLLWFPQIMQTLIGPLGNTTDHEAKSDKTSRWTNNSERTGTICCVCWSRHSAVKRIAESKFHVIHSVNILAALCQLHPVPDRDDYKLWLQTQF